MAGSRTRNYLAYGLGELVLLVIGILIALQIDNWNDDRIDRQREQEFLASMLDDLDADIGEIEFAVRGNTILLDGIDRLLGLLAEKDPGPDHSRQLLAHSVVYTFWYLRVDFPELTLTQLKSSGELLLIRDNQVREAMLIYEQGLEDCKHQYEEMTNYFHVMEASQKQIFDLSLARAAYDFIEEDFLRILGPFESFDPLIAEGNYLINDDPVLLASYYNDLLFYRSTLKIVSFLLQEQKQQANELTALIRTRYEWGTT